MLCKLCENSVCLFLHCNHAICCMQSSLTISSKGQGGPDRKGVEGVGEILPAHEKVSNIDGDCILHRIHRCPDIPHTIVSHSSPAYMTNISTT